MSGGTFLLVVLLGATVAHLGFAFNGTAGWRLAATLLVIFAFVSVTIGLIVRGLRADYWPLVNRFEFALCSVWAILAVYLLVAWPQGIIASGAFVLPFALLLALWAALRPATEQAIRPLSPALQSAWFPLHVGCAAVGYGAFTVAGALGTMLLVGERLRQKSVIAANETWSFPSSERTEYLIWRTVGLGFPWLTLSMLTGAIWAQVAWGRYWDWDPKESWTLITWLTYLILLHGRAIHGWRGRRVAWLAVIGLAAVLFTFLGVGWLVRTLSLESIHIF